MSVIIGRLYILYIIYNLYNIDIIYNPMYNIMVTRKPIYIYNL